MGKLLYPATMSLDGFIAGPGGDMSWLTRFMGVAHDPPPSRRPTSSSRATSALRSAWPAQAAGEKYACVLGAEIARGCLERGELDEVLVFVEPVLR